MLVPLRSKRAAARSVRVRDHGVSLLARFARPALALALRTGVAQPLLRARIAVPLPKDTANANRPVLLGYLRSALGCDDLELAIRVGEHRPNQKPLLTLLGRGGEVLGYAKVGWNKLTRDLVHSEADTLRSLAAAAPSAVIATPRVLHLGSWDEAEILIVSPLSSRRWARRRDTRATFAAMREIAALDKRGSEALASSGYWCRQRERTFSAGDQSLEALFSEIERRYGEFVISFGVCHGDWTPWNMGTCKALVSVWDWERSLRLAPDGIDAAHFDFQLALGRSRKPLQALDQALGSGRLMLAHLAVEPWFERMLLTLDLFEMALRYAEGTDVGPKRSAAPELVALEALMADGATAPGR
jgi:hypothetical protein